MLRQARKLTTHLGLSHIKEQHLPGPCGFESLGGQVEHILSLHDLCKIVKRKSRGKHEFAGLPCWTFLLLEEEARKCFRQCGGARSMLEVWGILSVAVSAVSCFVFHVSLSCLCQVSEQSRLACYHLEKSAPKIWRVHIRRVEMWNLIA